MHIGCVRLICLLFLPFISAAQGKFENVQIPLANGSYTYSGCEPSIDIHSNNPNNIAVGSILDGYHYSEDAGKTWKAKRLKSPYGVYGDPVL